MSDDGAQEQPVTEAPPSAAAEPSPPEIAAPAPPVTDVAPLEAATPPAPPAETTIVQDPAPAIGELPAEPIAPAIAEPPIAPIAPTEIAPTPPLPVPAPAPPKTRRGIPPMGEFAAWRLLELVATVAVAALLGRLLLPGDAPADALLLLERLSVTVPMLVLALVVAAVLGLPLGYLAARAGSWVDVGLRALATLGASLAPLWLAMLLVLLFSATLQWLQPGGFIPWMQSPLGALTSLLLPALALGLPLAAETALRMRDSLRAALADPMMRTADIMGLTRREAIRAHALRNALADLCPRLALPLALLVPASLIIENVFYLPGLGRLIFSALDARDFATLQLGLVALVALVALARLLVQLLHAAADPRLARRA